MNKNLSLGLVAALVIFGAYYFLSNRSVSSEDLSNFSVEDTAAVTKIFLADQNSNRVTVEKQADGTWIANSEFVVRKDAIKIILSTLKDIDIKRPTSKAERESIFKFISSNSVKVEVYQGDNLVKVIYVGTATKESKGTFMLLSDPETGKNAKFPYVVNLPGFIGNVRSHFLFCEISDIAES